MLFNNNRLLLHIRALESCSLMMKLRALYSRTPSLVVSDTLTQSSKPSIEMMFVGDKYLSIQHWNRVHQCCYKSEPFHDHF